MNDTNTHRCPWCKEHLWGNDSHKHYLNGIAATEDSFTSDEWQKVKTGDPEEAYKIVEEAYRGVRICLSAHGPHGGPTLNESHCEALYHRYDWWEHRIDHGEPIPVVLVFNDAKGDAVRVMLDVTPVPSIEYVVTLKSTRQALSTLVEGYREHLPDPDTP